MAYEDNSEKASTTGFTGPSSPSDPTIVDGLWDGRVSAVPWPNNTYIILEKETNRAICLGEHHGLYLSDDPNANNRWMVVERQGYFGFQNPQTGRYIGHNAHQIVHAVVEHMDAWESFVPRQHPKGGYQILSPIYWHTMHVVCVSGDGRGIERRQHGETRWEFVKA